MSPHLERLLPLAEVQNRTSYGRSSIYELMGKGQFPKAVRIGANRVAWPESAINAWIASKMAEAA